MEPWYEKAKKQCLASQHPDELMIALNKGLEITKAHSASEPVVFVWEVDQACEFKWPKTVIYTFGNNDPTFYLIHNGKKFVQGSPELLDFSE